MSDHRPDRYVEDGVVIWRASAIGGCVKALVAGGQGLTPEPAPAWLQRKFQEGIDGEPVVLARLAEAWNLLDEKSGWWMEWDDGQVLVEMAVGSSVIVRGHCDGVGQRFIDGDRKRKVVEVKCVSPDFFHEIVKVVPPRYFWQCTVYGRGLGLPVVLALGVKDEDGKVVLVHEMDVALAGPAAVKLRVMGLERHIADGTWPACSYRQFPCPYPELCEDHVPEATEDWELEDRLRESLVAIHVRH